MTINFEYKDVSASKRLEGLALERLEKLENKYDFIVNGDVYFKKENTSSDQTGRIVTIRLNIPGTTLIAEGDSAKFESSLAEATSDMQKQLQKKKDKMQSH